VEALEAVVAAATEVAAVQLQAVTAVMHLAVVIAVRAVALPQAARYPVCTRSRPSLHAWYAVKATANRTAYL